jgi:hypothetical protein
MKKKKKLFHVWHARKAICRKCSFKLFLLSFLSYLHTYYIFTNSMLLTISFIFSFFIFTYSIISTFSFLTYLIHIYSFNALNFFLLPFLFFPTYLHIHSLPSIQFFFNFVLLCGTGCGWASTPTLPF